MVKLFVVQQNFKSHLSSVVASLILSTSNNENNTTIYRLRQIHNSNNMANIFIVESTIHVCTFSIIY